MGARMMDDDGWWAELGAKMSRGNGPSMSIDREAIEEVLIRSRVANNAASSLDYLELDYWWDLMMDAPMPLRSMLVALIGGGAMMLLAYCLPRQAAGRNDQGAATASPGKTRADDPPKLAPARLPQADSVDDLERLGECAVCMEPMDRTAIGSCNHHFCVPCLLEICRLTPRCPRCQTTITAVWLDREFDALLRLARANEPPASVAEEPSASTRAAQDAAQDTAKEARDARLAEYVVRLRLPRGARAGITLRTCIGRPGVVVADLVVADSAYKCGLRVGDVLVNMNGVPCRSHRQCVALIDKLSKRNGSDEIACLIIPGVGVDAPVQKTSEPWEDELAERHRKEEVEVEEVEEVVDDCAIL